MMVLFSRHCLIFLLIVILLLGFTWSVWADEVYLTNGDRITGTIVRMEEKSLILDTTHSGEIRIDWKRVQGLSSKTPLTLELYDGSQFRGPVNVSESNELIMEEPEKLIVAEPPEIKSKDFFLTAIAAINPVPWLRYNGDASLGGNRTSGNSDTQAINSSTNWTFRFDRNRVGINARYNYGESVGTVTARNSRASLDYDYFLTEKVFVNIDELFEQDSFQDLTVRSSTSVGLGYQVSDTSELELAFIGGVGFVHQDFKTRSTIQNPTALWSINWGYWMIPDGVKLFLDHRGFQDFGPASSAVRVNSAQGIRIQLYKHLFLNLEYDIRFNSRPIFDNKKTDEAFIFGIGFVLDN